MTKEQILATAVSDLATRGITIEDISLVKTCGEFICWMIYVSEEGFDELTKGHPIRKAEDRVFRVLQYNNDQGIEYIARIYKEGLS